MKLQGKAIKYGNNVDTDVIIPARYLVTTDPIELALHCMEDLDPAFRTKKNPGDIMVGGSNFGCGSSREHAPLAIKGAEISAVIARSFARIFYRNAINIGLPIIESPEAVDNINEGDRVEINLDAGIIKNLTSGKEFSFPPLPQAAQDIFASGGLLPYAIARKNRKK